MLTKNPVEALSLLDRWVAANGNGKYDDRGVDLANIMANFEVDADVAMQQDREEIAEFIKVVCGAGLSGTALEIGLGMHGSTHFLWRLLFNRVVTVEIQPERVRQFANKYVSFYDGDKEKLRGSSFLYGSSHDPKNVRNAYHFAPTDLLFIDGLHTYDAILADWLLYSPMVRKGGIVAFHDTLNPSDGVCVSRILKDLSSGKMDGKQYEVQTILRSKNLGISYYFKA